MTGFLIYGTALDTRQYRIVIYAPQSKRARVVYWRGYADDGKWQTTTKKEKAKVITGAVTAETQRDILKVCERIPPRLSHYSISLEPCGEYV